MKPEMSIYLDFVRFAAAMVVFIGHLSGTRLSAGILWQFSGLMDAAVIVFFVLSGYVIAYIVETREATPRSYLTSRLARIYSVAFPAVLLALVLDPIGQAANPGLYESSWGYEASDHWLRALSLLTFTNELWNAHVTMGSLLPYWSLGYEVWYYILFGAIFFLRSWLRVVATILIGAVMGPKILLLLPIWIFGVAAYVLARREVVRPRIGFMLVVVSLIMAVLFAFLMRGTFGQQYVLAHTGLAARYIEGTIFSINIIGFGTICSFFSPVLMLMAKPVRYLAGMTFSLYLVHVPLAQFFAAMSHLPPGSISGRILVFGGTFFAIILFSHVTERRKRLWRNAFGSLLNGALWPDRRSIANPDPV